MFSAVSPGSTLALVLLGFCLVLVIAFEVSNGFHATANAVATFIYTNSLQPTVAVIGVAGLTGGPVSTTHVVTSGIAGTMVGSGAGAQAKTVWQIAAAWVLTLPCTVLLSGLLFTWLS